MRLSDHRSNVHSQSGEDGVIQEICRRLGPALGASPWCVEFGAWDGMFLSNTFTLVESHGWNAVYIESDAAKFADLTATAEAHPTIVPVHATVSGPVGSGSSLDDILGSTPLPPDYDVLSIDIDSTDLDVWAQHVSYRPKVVCIEVNSSLVPGIIQWHSSDRHPGNSFSATLQVARDMGYTLVCHTGNMILVADEHADAMGLSDLDRRYPERLFDWEWLDRQSTLRVRAVTAGTRLPEPVKDVVKKAMRRKPPTR